MQIENKTEFKKDMIKNIMRADGFDNQTYKTKKLVLNMSGLVCGMVSVSIFARTMYSIDDSYKALHLFLRRYVPFCSMQACMELIKTV